LDRTELFEESRREYLQERDEFQHSYVETGQKKRMGRRERTF